MTDWSWILAIDPGGTTGWAHIKNGDEKPQAFQDKPYDFLLKVHGLLSKTDARDAIIVCERFTITAATAKKSQQPEALEQIGAVRYLARYYADLDLHMQGPVEVMRLVDNRRLKALGWYVPGRDHSNDALRHLATYLAKRNELRLPT